MTRWEEILTKFWLKHKMYLTNEEFEKIGGM